MNVVGRSRGGEENYVGISNIEVSVEFSRDRFQIHFLNPPHLQSGLLPCILELFVYHGAQGLRGELDQNIV